MTQDDVDFENFIKLVDRRGSRRFLAHPVAPTGFGALEPGDNDGRLAEAMEEPLAQLRDFT